MQILNKRAKFDYEVIEKLEVGIELLGAEARALREGRGSLNNSYAKFIGDQLYLVNASIQAQGPRGYEATRSRKLLLHKKEARSLQGKMSQQKLTLVPMKVYNTRNLFKLELALAKSRKKYEKRELIKRRDLDRELERELK